MDRFPALRLILRFGRIGAAILALLVTAAATAYLWPWLGAWALLPAPALLVVSYYLLKSYVEIVQIVSEMAH
jgi:uncharacterized membrane protein YoaK (UPF0700 family)